MQVLKVFILLTLTGIFRFINCSFGKETELEDKIEKANIFFEKFDNYAFEELSKVANRMSEFDELAPLYSTIISFPSSANERIFSKIMENIDNEDAIFDEFMELYAMIIGNELDEIRMQHDEWIDEYIFIFSSDIKDAIVISVKKALESIESCFTSVSQSKCSSLEINPETVAVEDDFDSDDEEDEITPELNSGTVKCAVISEEEEQSILDEIWRSSSRCTSPSPKASVELKIIASSVLQYGIGPKDRLFPVTKKFLEFVRKYKFKIINPNEIYSEKYQQKAFNLGFDYFSVGFQDFCNYVGNGFCPITSSLYNGYCSEYEILTAKVTALMNLVIEDITRLIDAASFKKVHEILSSKNIAVDLEIVEFIVYRIKDHIAGYLLSFDPSSSLIFINGLKATLDAACTEISETIGLSDENILFPAVKELFMVHLQSPLAFVKYINNMEEWDNNYNEQSPLFKGSPSPSSRISSPERKSVLIDEYKNKVLFIDSLADISKSKSKPIKRSPSSSEGLNNTIKLSIINPENISQEQFDAAEDFDAEVSEYFNENGCKFNVPALEQQVSSSKAFVSTEVPDFPFENPVESIEDPVYIKATFDYFLQNGDDSCFMLDERITSIKEGLNEFLSSSFENYSAIFPVQTIIEDQIDFIFKP